MVSLVTSQPTVNIVPYQGKTFKVHTVDLFHSPRRLYWLTVWKLFVSFMQKKNNHLNWEKHQLWLTGLFWVIWLSRSLLIFGVNPSEPIITMNKIFSVSQQRQMPSLMPSSVNAQTLKQVRFVFFVKRWFQFNTKICFQHFLGQILQY